MASTLILSVQDGSISFGEKTIFDGLSFNIQEGDKISLVGKNGTGKTTLMNVITGDRDLDSGERWMLQGTTIGYLRQEVVPVPGQTVYDFVFEQIKKEGLEEASQYKVDMVIEPLGLAPGDRMDRLSGGQLRRAALARALVEEPDILMLDEPTNHLDLDVIEWLEGFLNAYRGAILCVSHDKAFLANISNRIFWLDRGKMRTCPKGFAHFDNWSEQILEQEARELDARQKLLEQEMEWASRGVKARRKRNVRRLDLMKAEREKLRRDQGAFRRMMAKIEVGDMELDAIGPHVVAEFFKVGKSFSGDDGRETLILDGFSLRISRGDRIGILGRNGSGKTTFLRLLTGEVKPEKGKVKLARDLSFSYFDQKRRDLVPDDTLQQALCPNGGDHLNVMGKVRHVCGYLKDFMFDPALAGQRVCTLSGGQKNRLLLAKVLAEPRQLLILDEPTNDLDMETLDMLEEILSQYQGTLIVVSHDRDFLDQTVSKILAFEGGGKVEGYIGGYSDYVEARRRAAIDAGEQDTTVRPASRPKTPDRDRGKGQQAAANPSGKLTYKLQYELDGLPTKIAVLEKEVDGLERLLEDTGLFARDRGAFDTASKRLVQARADLALAEERWLELDDMKQHLEG